jgi:hypothetical protein
MEIMIILGVALIIFILMPSKENPRIAEIEKKIYETIEKEEN